jgi:hypothetical protein
VNAIENETTNLKLKLSNAEPQTKDAELYGNQYGNCGFEFTYCLILSDGLFNSNGRAAELKKILLDQGVNWGTTNGNLLNKIHETLMLGFKEGGIIIEKKGDIQISLMFVGESLSVKDLTFQVTLQKKMNHSENHLRNFTSVVDLRGKNIRLLQFS